MPLPEIPVVALPSEVTIDRIGAIEQSVEGAVGPEGTTLVVDLSRTVFLCSAGLGMLVKISKRLHERGGALALGKPMPPVVRLLRAVGLDAVLPDFPSVEAALRFVRAGKTAKTS